MSSTSKAIMKMTHNSMNGVMRSYRSPSVFNYPRLAHSRRLFTSAKFPESDINKIKQRLELIRRIVFDTPPEGGYPYGMRVMHLVLAYSILKAGYKATYAKNFTKDTTERQKYMKEHKAAGEVVLYGAPLRLAIKYFSQIPKPLLSGNPAIAVKVFHGLIYLAMFAVPAMGKAIGHPWLEPFGFEHQNAREQGLRFTHKWSGRSLLLSIPVHAGGAVSHGHQGLVRMWGLPRLSPIAETSKKVAASEVAAAVKPVVKSVSPKNSGL